MSRRNDGYPCNLGPEAVIAFGEACEFVGGILGVSGSRPGIRRKAELGLRNVADLAQAHEALLGAGGGLRTQEARIYHGAQVAHTPPAASMVASLTNELMGYLSHTEEHPLIASCVFHYQLLFIHPFDDGNGRLARECQARIIAAWTPSLGMLDLEGAVSEHREAYLESLSIADRRKDSGPFVQEMLGLIRDLLSERYAQCARQRSMNSCLLPEPVERLIRIFGDETLTAAVLMGNLGMSHRGTFRKNYLDVALDMGLAEMTQPDSPRSPTQRYRLTARGKDALEKMRAQTKTSKE